MSTKSLEDREFQFVFISSLLSNTLFIKKQNASILQGLFIHNVFQKLFSEWKPYMENIACKSWEIVKVEKKKNWY